MCARSLYFERCNPCLSKIATSKEIDWGLTKGFNCFESYEERETAPVTCTYPLLFPGPVDGKRILVHWKYENRKVFHSSAWSRSHWFRHRALGCCRGPTSWRWGTRRVRSGWRRTLNIPKTAGIGICQNYQKLKIFKNFPILTLSDPDSIPFLFCRKMHSDTFQLWHFPVSRNTSHVKAVQLTIDQTWHDFWAPGCFGTKSDSESALKFCHVRLDLSVCFRLSVCVPSLATSLIESQFHRIGTTREYTNRASSSVTPSGRLAPCSLQTSRARPWEAKYPRPWSR